MKYALLLFSLTSPTLAVSAQDLATGVIQQIEVYGLPIHASTMEYVQPITVITDDELRSKSTATLGETLKNEVGIHSSYYGPVASSPIIRGLDGPRVLITQNGLDVGDASRGGPDHLVSTETGSAEQIEILRGPATLFYGAGAIGGVVNVLDDRVPKSNDTKAQFSASHNTVAKEKQAGFGVTAGAGSFAYHLDGFWRYGENYKLPRSAVHEMEHHHNDEIDHEEIHRGQARRLFNSAASSQSLNLGASYLMEAGFIGISYGKLARNNGVPGHGHFEENAGAEHEAEKVGSELRQDRWQLLSEISVDTGFLTSINSKIGYTDYQHQEIHGDADHTDGNTLFENTTLQGRTDLLHRELSGWHGALSLEYKNTDFSSIGAEAFTPPAQTDTWALALVEEKHLGKTLWQLGARIENTSLKANGATLPIADHDHRMDEEEQVSDVFSLGEYDFTPYSLSAGLVWNFTAGYKFGLSYAYSQRAPSAAELFALGPHIGTRTYEVGGLFDIHEEAPGEFHLDFIGIPTKEKSDNIDISLRKHAGNLGFVFNAFYNEIGDYYYQADTGLTNRDLFDHSENDTHEHDAELPVYIFRQEDAEFYGVELELMWRPADYLQWTLWGDIIQAELKSGEYLPRTPPKRIGMYWELRRNAWAGKLSTSHNFQQDHTSFGETTTGSYTLLDAEVTYTWTLNGADVTLFMQADNLADEEARVHSSFLKDQAPLPGRGFRLGLRGVL